MQLEVRAKEAKEGGAPADAEEKQSEPEEKAAPQPSKNAASSSAKQALRPLRSAREEEARDE
jgi:hypothetical protein